MCDELIFDNKRKMENKIEKKTNEMKKREPKNKQMHSLKDEINTHFHCIGINETSFDGEIVSVCKQITLNK